jgi:hypothetical protein
MILTHARIVALLAAFMMLMSCDDAEPPSRDHIPALKARLFRLQEAVKEQNRATIDSLLSVQILDNEQNSDSLLRFTYGADGSFDFRQFAAGDIIYTHDKARIDCFVMDSAQRRDRPLTLTYVFEHGQWLLKRFEAGEVETDSAQSDNE